MSNSPLRRSGTTRANEGSHSFTCHPHVYPQVEWVIPAYGSRSKRPRYTRNNIVIRLGVSSSCRCVIARTVRYKFEFSKIQYGGYLPFWKLLNRQNSATVQRIAMKFVRWRTLTSPAYINSTNFDFKNPRCWRVAILKIGKSSIGNGSTDLHEIWHDDQSARLDGYS